MITSLPPNPKPKFDSELLSMISELEKKLAQLGILSRFVALEHFDLLLATDCVNNVLIDFPNAVICEKYFSNPHDFPSVINQINSLELVQKIIKDVKPVRLIKSLHQEIVGKENNSGGDFRSKEKQTNAGTFILPANVDELMTNLETYLLHEVNFHPLVNAAIIHGQFELIHPFNSYNGVVGRLLTQLHLVWKRKLERPSLLLSSYLLKRKLEYFDRLEDLQRNNNWNGWIKFMLSVFLESTEKSLALIEKLNQIEKENVSLSIKNTFATPALLKVLRFMGAKPISTIQQLAAELNLSKQTLNLIINKLLEEKILTESSGKQRYRVFVNERVLKTVCL